MSYASWSEMFLAMSPEARKQYIVYRERFRGLTAYPILPEESFPVHSREEMIAFARKHELTDMEKLERGIKLFCEDAPPTCKQIEFMFGDMKGFFRFVSPLPQIGEWGTEISDRKMAELCATLRVFTCEDYLKMANRIGMGWFPSLDEIEDRYGSWELFQHLVASFCFDEAVKKYFEESIAEGKPLGFPECRRKSIDLKMLVDFFGAEVLATILARCFAMYEDFDEDTRAKFTERKIIGKLVNHENRKRNKK